MGAALGRFLAAEVQRLGMTPVETFSAKLRRTSACAGDWRAMLRVVRSRQPSVDDCVVFYKFDRQTGLWVASGCGSVTVLVTPTPTPR